MTLATVLQSATVLSWQDYFFGLHLHRMILINAIARRGLRYVTGVTLASTHKLSAPPTLQEGFTGLLHNLPWPCIRPTIHPPPMHSTRLRLPLPTFPAALVSPPPPPRLSAFALIVPLSLSASFSPSPLFSFAFSPSGRWVFLLVVSWVSGCPGVASWSVGVSLSLRSLLSE